jgi:hypothetical protein
MSEFVTPSPVGPHARIDQAVIALSSPAVAASQVSFFGEMTA